MSTREVAVLGAGILGVCTALWLARRGVRVTLLEAAERPLAGASRWNEGKIHLGHLYAADPGLGTARRLLPGGLAFRPLLEQLIGASLAPAITGHDDTYLVHRDSVVRAEAMANYLDAVTALARAHPQAGDYLADLRPACTRALTVQELDARCDTATIVAGFRAPERSVDTQWVADRLCDALAAQPRIHTQLRTRVMAVVPGADGLDAPLHVQVQRDGDAHRLGPFDHVVNALWEGRLAIDAGLGLPLPAQHTHRYRLSAFLEYDDAPHLESAVIATGPFGDIKAYPGGRFYLSWYDAGLLAQGRAIAPPTLPELDDARQQAIIGDILGSLRDVIPGVRALETAAPRVRLEGGWVYAVGAGTLADPASALHRRDDIGLRQHGRYLSVETGKYSIAPWLAARVADRIAPAG